MEKFHNKNVCNNLGDLNNKNSIYHMQHSSLFIANKFSAPFLEQFENKIKELNGTIYNLKTQLKKKEEEIKSLKNNLSSESILLLPKYINTFLKMKEPNQLQEAEFLEDMNKKNNRISKSNEKIKENREKEKKNSNIDLIKDNSKEIEQELKEEKKIKPSILSKENKNIIQNFREKFFLKEKEYTDEKIIDALKKNDYDFEYAFASFFCN